MGVQRNNNKRRSTTKSTNTKARKKRSNSSMKQQEMYYEIISILAYALTIFFTLCNFSLIGPVGEFFKGIMFGLFGFIAYIVPIIGLVIWFLLWKKKQEKAVLRVVLLTTTAISISAVFSLIANHPQSLEAFDVIALYDLSSKSNLGGGVLGGSFAYMLYSTLDLLGTILVLTVMLVISVVIFTEKSVIRGVHKTGRMVGNRVVRDAKHVKEYAHRTSERIKETREADYSYEQEVLQLEEDTLPRSKKKVKGVMIDTLIEKPKVEADAIPEPKMLREEKPVEPVLEKPLETQKEVVLPISVETEAIREITARTPKVAKVEQQVSQPLEPTIHREVEPSRPVEITKPVPAEAPSPKPVVERKPEPEERKPEELPIETLATNALESSGQSQKRYQFPPIHLLNKAKTDTNMDSVQLLKETALHLQQCLETFGVKVSVTDISQGPSVTRYELQPEQGVKVSKIVNLADDIKLNLAATDIRIEAPIPGKAAVGIEVPNKENSMVSFRDLIESNDFKSFDSNLSFAVGKDIAGKTVVTDIAKMPHMLVAGSTGSGKSVCINTLIMSILYKAHPDDVKLIMIDPKVVELSVYNGIPHLLIPVVTEPKKAAGALYWGVAEMTDRYNKFSDMNVRDLKGYNAKVEEMAKNGDATAGKKLPQIVIIVDELADLMMVAPGEVEESICRLAQLARAAGIHLIIATQRPSVDVITGLIKANMPSRVAFAVSSGVDSRTILDMNGAEKLLGKGDMLFYPQGYSKPARVQGSFVSDTEVSNVVDFLKNQQLGNVYDVDIESQIKNIGASSGEGASGSGGNERDELFAEAGRYMIEKDKASIGMLQRVFKIGFNRAARIVDQLNDYGVVSDEVGTKPRKVLMSLEQFELLLEEI